MFCVLKKPLSAKLYFSAVGGLTFLLLIFWFLNQPVLKHQLSTVLGFQEPLTAAPDSFYHVRVQPVFEKYCAACHGDKKEKGQLRLDDYLYSRFSGKSGHNVVPYDIHKSLILTRMSLPRSDKRLMPPLGWDRPTEDERKVVELWIDNGASATHLVGDFPEAPELIVDVVIPKIEKEKILSERAAFDEQMKAINKKMPFSLSYLSRNSADLRFTNVSMRSPFDDSTLHQLAALSERIVSLYLRDTRLTNASFKTLSLMSNLEEWYLNGSDIDAETLSRIVKGMPNLKKLSIQAWSINEELVALCEIKGIHLREIVNG